MNILRCLRAAARTIYQWEGKVFRCLEREVERDEDGAMRVIITARAEISSVYDDLVTADYTTGTSVTNALQSEPPDEPTGLTAVPKRGAIEFSWTLGTFWDLNGISELWEYTAATPFSSATKIWEGRANSVTISKLDTTTRYYWVRTRAIGGQVSGTEPATNGLAAAATAIVETFNATDAGPITKTLTAPAGGLTEQVAYVEITHPPTSDVEVTVAFRLGAATAAAPGAWHVDVTAFWGTTGGSVNFIGQKIVKETTTYEIVTVVGRLPPGSVVGSATRRFGVAVDIFGDGVNNVTATFRDITVVSRVTHFG